MESTLNSIDKMLAPLFKDLPPLPKGAKDWFVNAWPILALIFGVLQLLAAWGLWHLGHVVNAVANYTNTYAQLYGTGTTVNGLGFFYWVGLIVLIVDGLILLLAYSGLKARSKRGWNMLFLAALVNLAYGVLLALDNVYGGFGRLIWALVTSAIVFYFIYQVRSYYVGSRSSASGASEAR
jgi:hypothetical protein